MFSVNNFQCLVERFAKYFTLIFETNEVHRIFNNIMDIENPRRIRWCRGGSHDPPTYASEKYKQQWVISCSDFQKIDTESRRG